MRDTIAMPPKKTYPGVLFPFTIIVLVIMIGLAYTTIMQQQQLSEQQSTLLSVNNQLQQLNKIVLGGSASELVEQSDTSPEVLAEENRVIGFDKTGLQFQLPAGFVEIGDPVLTDTADAGLHTTYVYKDELREYFWLTVINGSGEVATLKTDTWKLSAKITVAEKDAEMYRGNESNPGTELYVIPADGAQVGFMFKLNEDVTAEPDFTFDEAIARTLASVEVIE